MVDCNQGCAEQISNTSIKDITVSVIFYSWNIYDTNKY